MNEQTFTFECQGNQLCGIVHETDKSCDTGVLIVVGGPQYRVGSHRQFVTLARYLAENEIPVMRFDYTGMGDSSGEKKEFDTIEADITSAIDTFFNRTNAIKRVVLWGLCDAASASLFYAPHDRRVSGLVLLNPWVHTEAGEAKTFLKHYYRDRFFERGFWHKILKGQFDHVSSAKSIFNRLLRIVKQREPTSSLGGQHASLPDRMLEAYKAFEGSSLIILSEKDLTAKEFGDLIKNNTLWKQAMEEKGTEIAMVESADHTFSNSRAKRAVENLTLQFVQRLLNTFD